MENNLTDRVMSIIMDPNSTKEEIDKALDLFQREGPRRKKMPKLNLRKYPNPRKLPRKVKKEIKKDVSETTWNDWLDNPDKYCAERNITLRLSNNGFEVIDRGGYILYYILDETGLN